MWALSYSKDYCGHKAGELHLVIGGKFDPAHHKMSVLECAEVPDQDVWHLCDEMGVLLLGKTLYDLQQYTPEEAARTPSASRAALKERGPIGNEKTIANLRDRLALVEQIIGV